jgi:hypothetical protein
MRIHVFSPDYGKAGFTLPCPACGHEYDPGDWYFSRPCPRCGLDTDGDSLPWWVHSVVQGLRHRLGLPVERVREGLAGLIGVSPKTLKGWEYRYCSSQNWRRFAEAVKAFLERAEAGKRSPEKGEPRGG